MLRAIKYVGQTGTSGYATAGKRYLANFILDDVPVSWHQLKFDNSKNDTHHFVDILAESAIDKEYKEYSKLIIHSTPDIWKKYSEQYHDIQRKIGYCTWETNKLPITWVSHINQLPEIWVPSSFNKETFINSGVTSNIKIIPHLWFDQNLPPKEKIELQSYNGIITLQQGYNSTTIPNNKYTFYCIGEMNTRKGIDDLITVFNKFNDKYKDTQLILKLHYTWYHDKTINYILEQLNQLTDKINKSIFVILHNLSNRGILALHSFGDCYISLNKGEGFGLTIFDAYHLKKKIITTGYGGQLDYLTINHPGLVNYKMAPVYGMDNFNKLYTPDQYWAIPDLDHAYHVMEYTYLNK